VRVSLDDFGTGQSSLTQLQKLPIDAIKIDRSFVSGLGTGGTEARIVESLILLAKSLGLQVVAEGVETEAQLDWLRGRRCDLAQGYLLGRPAPAGGDGVRS
jgi:EAL domain-containing protein (putative c-di-GMP-specific phosphodiesterase class I)